jgi:hypothetical protein
VEPSCAAGVTSLPLLSVAAAQLDPIGYTRPDAQAWEAHHRVLLVPDCMRAWLLVIVINIMYAPGDKHMKF